MHRVWSEVRLHQHSANYGRWPLPRCKFGDLRPLDPADRGSESHDPDAVAQFTWIPEQMLLALLKRDVTIEMR